VFIRLILFFKNKKLSYKKYNFIINKKCESNIDI